MNSRDETLLQALLDGKQPEDFPVISRVDQYLLACCLGTGTDGLPQPISRIDILLYALAAKMLDGGEASLSEYLNGTRTELREGALKGLEQVPAYAFYNNLTLQKIFLPDSCKKIGEYAFYACSALTAAKISDAVTAVPTNCFARCAKLEEVVIGESVTSIGASAFANAGTATADGLSLYMRGDKPPTLGSGVFSSAKLNEIYVSSKGWTAYKEAPGWSSYEDKIILFEALPDPWGPDED